MDNVNAVGYGSALTPEVKGQYAVKCIKMAQESQAVAGSIIQDSVEISKEAMDKFQAERK